ncbi:MAG: mannose-1-phosphate guanylyltransferase/mannose-6-phosphate isomerase [Nitrospirota bacterium]|nr:mannose-1-phosphate guanylyltransferase/mannose-6-phosphate isomerase [Nitrospirota bacterium]
MTLNETTTEDDHIMYGVILAGGSGTRFWPLSREEYPKQLLKIFGDQTLIQATVSRISGFISPQDLFIVTNPQQIEQMRYQLSQQESSSKPNYISEPEKKNTAAAIALAALTLQKRDPEAVMAVLSADHFIKDEVRFIETLRLAAKVAQDGSLVTLGAKPTRPETAYGYISPGKERSTFKSVFEVEGFIEKPNRSDAEKYLREKKTLWNTGIFVWKVSAILNEINRFLPELSLGFKKISETIGTDSEKETLERLYPQLPSISIDYGVLERSDRLVVIPTDMGWEDVGSWNALDEVIPKDKAGNIITGNVLNVGSTNSTIYAGKRVVAAVGLQNLVVVDTEDATLVCNKNNAQDVKKVVELLKQQKGDVHRVHPTVIRAWGSYTVLEEGLGYKIKKIMVNPGAKLSLQMHHKRSEHWVVVEGIATVTCGESVYTIQTNQSTFVPMGVKHRLENATDQPLRLVEVQSGVYLGEDDIVRFEDIYGRVSQK